MRDSRMLHMS